MTRTPEERITIRREGFAGRAELPRLRVRCPALLQTFVFSLGELLFNNFGELQTPLPILGLSESRPLRGGFSAHELPHNPQRLFIRRVRYEIAPRLRET